MNSINISWKILVWAKPIRQNNISQQRQHLVTINSEKEGIPKNVWTLNLILFLESRVSILVDRS